MENFKTSSFVGQILRRTTFQMEQNNMMVIIASQTIIIRVLSIGKDGQQENRLISDGIRKSGKLIS